jgi:hypothetical protein
MRNSGHLPQADRLECAVKASIQRSGTLTMGAETVSDSAMQPLTMVLRSLGELQQKLTFSLG